MKIAYDISILEGERYTGVEKLAFFLFSEFWRNYQEIEHVAFCRKRSKRFDRFPEYVTIKEIPGKQFWRYTALPKALKKEAADLFISPVMALPFPCSTPMLAYVHECQWRHKSNESGSWRHRLYFWLSASRSKILLTNSEFTKKDMIADLGSREKDIHVIHAAGDPSLSQLEPCQKQQLFSKFAIPENEPYCLFVSTIRPKKNVETLIRAFNQPLLQNINLVLAGKVVDQGLVELAKTLNCKNVIFTDYVSDGELKTLYQNASSFLYISAHEGFGLPVLEAYEYALPVIASSGGSIPEVAGKGAILIDNPNPDTVSEAVNKLLFDKPLRERLKAEAKKQLAKFAWKNSADKLYEVIKNSPYSSSLRVATNGSRSK